MFYVDEENVGHDKVFVKSADCDCFYKAKPSFYFSLNQEMGGLHANEKGCSLKQIYDSEQKTWMILRTRMEIDAIASWTDTIELRTWCQEGYRLYGPRIIEAIDEKTKAPLFSSISWWVIMDIARKRPCKPDYYTERLPFADKSKYYKNPVLPAFPAIDETKEECFDVNPVRINYYDTDYNRHVNNISYVNWMLESFPKDFLDKNEPTLLDVKWEKQSFYTDNLETHTYCIDEDKKSYLTRIMREEECVFEGMSNWRKKNQ